MKLFSDTTRCPDCGHRLPVAPVACPSCGLPLTGRLAVDLVRTLSVADGILDRLRASAVPASPAPPSVAGVSSTGLVPGLAPDTDPAPAPAPVRRRGLEAASVPMILLGLGALCLLVAAITFLAVAWSSLGVGGRTAVLVGLTLATGATGAWLARRGLRIAAESLTVVAFGLLTLDVVGADNASWLGDLSVPGLVLVIGVVMSGVALVWMLVGRASALSTPQLAAVLGLTMAAVGALALTSSPDAGSAVTALAVVTHLALAALGRALGLRLLPVVALGVGGSWWLGLALDGLNRAGEHATVRALWLELHAWPLVVATLLLLTTVAVRHTLPPVARAGAAGAAVLGSLTVAMPALDESATSLAQATLVGLLVWSLALVAVPRSWTAVPTAPLLLALVPGLTLGSSLALEAAAATLSVGDPFTRGTGVRIGDVDATVHPALLVPLTAALLLAGVALARWRVAPLVVVREYAAPLLAVVVLAGVATTALYAVPLGVVVAGLAVLVAGLVVVALPRTTVDGTAYAAAALLVALGATLVALPSAVLTAGALTVLAVATAAVAVRGRFPQALPSAEMLLPAAVAALLWTVLEVASVDPALRAAPILMVVLGAALVWPRPTVEVSAWTAGLVAAAAAVPLADVVATSLALHLTLAGALVTASSLVNSSRRELGWVGGLLLAAATWVRLADLGVDEPEAYTLPSAVALVLVGLWHLARNPEASTRVALGPGLALATVPSLLVVLGGDPVSLRALLLGLGALALVLVGTRLRWSAPVGIGAAVGGLLVLRELAPYAAETPQWVLIGLAGTVLTLVGVTWESRLGDLHRTTAYLARLR